MAVEGGVEVWGSPGGVRPRRRGVDEVIVGGKLVSIAGLETTLCEDGEVIQRHQG